MLVPVLVQAIGAFYLDPYARPEEKNGGAWMNSLQGRSAALAPAAAPAWANPPAR